MPEIDESELANFKQLTNFVQSAMSNPETRRQMQKIQKTLNPNAVVPELDAAEPVMKEVNDLRSNFEKLAEEIRAEREERTKNAKLADLRSEFDKGRAALRKQGYTDEAIEKIEKLMEDKGVADHEIAAAAFDRMNPAPAPIASSNRGFDLFSPAARADDFLKPLFEGNDAAFLDKAINETLRGTRGY